MKILSVLRAVPVLYFATVGYSAIVSENVGGFSFRTPDVWRRIANNRTALRPTTQFDTIFCQDPKRMMVPAGWEDADEAKVTAATETLVTQQFQLKLKQQESRTVQSSSGVTIRRVQYSTDSADTPIVVLYSFKISSGVQVFYMCPVPRSGSEAALREYDAVWLTLEIHKPSKAPETGEKSVAAPVGK